MRTFSFFYVALPLPHSLTRTVSFLFALCSFSFLCDSFFFRVLSLSRSLNLSPSLFALSLSLFFVSLHWGVRGSFLLFFSVVVAFAVDVDVVDDVFSACLFLAVFSDLIFKILRKLLFLFFSFVIFTVSKFCFPFLYTIGLKNHLLEPF